MVDEGKESFFPEYTRSQIQVVILRSVVELRFLEKRFRQPVACFDETIHRLSLKRIRDDQEAISVKGLSLLWFQANEIQLEILSPSRDEIYSRKASHHSG